MQTAYNQAPAIGRVGAIAESAEGIHSVAKIANVIIPFGCFVCKDTDDKLAKLPTSAAEVLLGMKSGGVAVATHAIITDDSSGGPTVPSFPVGKEFAAMRKGPIFVLVEEDVTQGDQAFVRFANHVAAQNANYLAVGNADQKGAFRKSYDGTAQVDTLTPTVNNADGYAVEIMDSNGKLIASASYESDGTATAAEIVAGLIAALGAPAGLSFSGTNTLVITSSVPGQGFVTSCSANLTVAHTTANAVSAAPLPGAYFKSSASAGSLAVLELNLGGN